MKRPGTNDPAGVHIRNYDKALKTAGLNLFAVPQRDIRVEEKILLSRLVFSLQSQVALFFNPLP